MMIDVHLRNVATGERSVYHDSHDYRGGYSPEHQGSEPDDHAFYFWCGPKGMGYFGQYNGLRVEKIVERGTGRVIYEGLTDDD